MDLRFHEHQSGVYEAQARMCEERGANESTEVRAGRIDATGNFHVNYREVMNEKQREAQRAAVEMRSSDPRQNFSLPPNAKEKLLADSVKAQNRNRRMNFKMPSDDEDLEHAIASSLEDKAMCRTIEFDNHEVDRAILECLQAKHHQNLLQPVSGREKEDLKRALRESNPRRWSTGLVLHQLHAHLLKQSLMM